MRRTINAQHRAGSPPEFDRGRMLAAVFGEDGELPARVI
jgi:hypothetical protein